MIMDTTWAGLPSRFFNSQWWFLSNAVPCVYAFYVSVESATLVLPSEDL